MVVFDSSILLLVLDPHAKAPNDPASGKVVEKAAERIEYLIENLSADKEKIVIPTPVLSEVLVHAGEAMQPYIETLNGHAAFRIAPFDQKAAIEAALAMSDAIRRGGHRVDAANPDATKTKIKFDRQIVAVAKVEGAHTVYSDDDDVHKYANRAGLKAYRTAELDVRPEDPQQSLDFNPNS
ncbi:PIN domain-containing protein [Ruegeria sp. HKCCSP335]|uniref:type II toxin-antitoxin system VapC family toxin n=1 Tax=Ruegeria sp. HKCCSP335 TaxID=2794833 RepID=UPI001AE729C8|nr:PIN domain-containing protein [Ruegeria sp. HKCCSP335]